MCIQDHVEFLGFIGRYKDVIKIFSKSQILVHSSILEDFGIIIVDSMSYHIPFVALDIPPIREVSKEGKGGCLFIPRNIHDLGMKIVKI